MNGCLKAEEGDAVIATAETPEELYEKVSPKPTTLSPTPEYKKVSPKPTTLSPTPEYSDYTRLKRGTLPVCPKGRYLTLEQCREAGLILGAKLRDGTNVVVGKWTHTPSGCFTNPTEDNAIHYSVNSRGTPDHRYSLLCTKSLSSVDKYVQYARGSAARCLDGKSLTKKECHEAGLAFNGFFRDGRIQVGSWSHTPSGCFLNPTEDNAIHYAVNVGGTKADNRYTILCKKSNKYVQHARGSAARCPAGKSLTIDQCHEAGLEFRGIFRDGRIQVGSWSHTPSGCFLNPTEDNAIHYAVNVGGTKADNRYTILCLK